MHVEGECATAADAGGRVVEPGGVFGFSAERAAATERFTLRASLRYAHGEAYLRELAATHGYAVLQLQTLALREDAGRPIDGLIVLLRAGTAMS